MNLSHNCGGKGWVNLANAGKLRSRTIVLFERLNRPGGHLTPAFMAQKEN